MTEQTQVVGEPEPVEPPDTSALETEVAELKAKNEQLQSAVEEYDKITLDPSKLSQYLDEPLTQDPSTRPKEATEGGLKREDLSDEGRLIYDDLQKQIEVKEATFIRNQRQISMAQELATIQEANPTLFNELKEDLARAATQNPGITPKTAWKLVTQEHNLEKAKEEARAEVKEDLKKKDSTSKVSKPGHTATVTQTTPAKDKKEAFEQAWTELGESADAL